MQKFTLTSVLSLRERKQVCTGVTDFHELVAVMWSGSFAIEGEG
jgi:hypothetical protein